MKKLEESVFGFVELKAVAEREIKTKKERKKEKRRKGKIMIESV